MEDSRSREAEDHKDDAKAQEWRNQEASWIVDSLEGTELFSKIATPLTVWPNKYSFCMDFCAGIFISVP